LPAMYSLVHGYAERRGMVSQALPAQGEAALEE